MASKRALPPDDFQIEPLTLKFVKRFFRNVGKKCFFANLPPFRLIIAALRYLNNNHGVAVTKKPVFFFHGDFIYAENVLSVV